MAVGVALIFVGATYALGGERGDEQEKIVDLSERWRVAVSNRDPFLSELVSSASKNHYGKLKQLALYGEADALQELHPTDQLQALLFRTMLDPTELKTMSPLEVIAFAVETGMIGVDLRKNDELREVIVIGNSAQGRLYKFGRDDRPDRGLQYFENEEGVWRIDLKSELERLRNDFSAFVARSSLAPDEAAFFILEARLFRKVTSEDFIPPLAKGGRGASPLDSAGRRPQEELALRIVSIRQSLDDPAQNAVTIENRHDSLHHVLRVGDPLPPAPRFVLAEIEGRRAELRAEKESLILELEEDDVPLGQRPAETSQFDEGEPVSLLTQAQLGDDRDGLMVQWRNVGLRGRPQLLQQASLVPEFAPDRERLLGLRVRNLVKGSFWHQLGLAEGDLLEQANGYIIDSMDRWQDLLRTAGADEEVSIRVRRAGRSLRFHTKTIPPTEPGRRTAIQGSRRQGRRNSSGLSVSLAASPVRSQKNRPRGQNRRGPGVWPGPSRCLR